MGRAGEPQHAAVRGRHDQAHSSGPAQCTRAAATVAQGQHVTTPSLDLRGPDGAEQDIPYGATGASRDRPSTLTVAQIRSSAPRARPAKFCGSRRGLEPAATVRRSCLAVPVAHHRRARLPSGGIAPSPCSAPVPAAQVRQQSPVNGSRGALARVHTRVHNQCTFTRELAGNRRSGREARRDTERPRPGRFAWSGAGKRTSRPIRRVLTHGSSPTADAPDWRPARTPCQRTGAGKTTAQRRIHSAPWTATPENNSHTSSPPESPAGPLPKFSGLTKPELLRILCAATLLTLETGDARPDHVYA